MTRGTRTRKDMDTAIPSAPKKGAAVSTYMAYGTNATPAWPQQIFARLHL